MRQSQWLCLKEMLLFFHVKEKQKSVSTPSSYAKDNDYDDNKENKFFVSTNESNLSMTVDTLIAMVLYVTLKNGINRTTVGPVITVVVVDKPDVPWSRTKMLTNLATSMYAHTITATGNHHLKD